MPDLSHSLHGRDLGFLKIVARLWGLELNEPDANSALPVLAGGLQDPSLVAEVVEILPDEAQAALAYLLQNKGRAPWPVFNRLFGSIREMGPGQRDRSKPYQSPISATELLYYRALIGRDFLATPDGPREFAYIPDDLVALLPKLREEQPREPGRLATPAERAYPMPASDEILEAATTLLAGLRMGWPAERVPLGSRSMPAPALRVLLTDTGLLDPQGMPLPEPARAFLETGRGEALLSLVNAWLNSPNYNELCMLPGLRCEGEWSSDPVRARQAVLGLLKQVSPDHWWSLASFVAHVKEQQPDFQRPAGDYDSWFIRDTASGEFLRGFGAWDRVDGALVRWLISGPLYWLGVVDLAGPEEDAPAAAFRFTPWGLGLLDGLAPTSMPREESVVHVASNGRIRVPRLTPRAARYQVARCCAWEGERDGPTGLESLFRITPASLETARRQGLRVSHLLALLRKHASGPVPPSLVQAMERWDQSGVQVRLEPVTLLRLGSPEILAALRRGRAGRFLGDPLGPTTVIVLPGASAKVMAALAELGYLAEGDLDSPDGVIIKSD